MVVPPCAKRLWLLLLLPFPKQIPLSQDPLYGRRLCQLLAEGLVSMITIYHLIIKQPGLFFPIRSLFMPYIANSLNKPGMSGSATLDSCLPSVDILQVIFNWEEQAMRNVKRGRHYLKINDTMTPIG